jgi:transposase
MEIAVLGIDLGKNSCSIVGLDAVGAVVLRRRMRREGVIKLTGKLKRCVVAMEACCGRIISAAFFGLRVTRFG